MYLLTFLVISRLRVWEKGSRMSIKNCYFSCGFTVFSEPEGILKLKEFIDIVWFNQVTKARKLKRHPEKHFRMWIIFMRSIWTGKNVTKTWTYTRIKSLFRKHPTGCLLHCQAYYQFHQHHDLEFLTAFFRGGIKK